MPMKVDGVPVDLRHRMKYLAGIRGMRLRDAVIEAMKRWCENSEAHDRQYHA